MDLITNLNEQYSRAMKMKEIARNDDRNLKNYVKLIKQFKMVINTAEAVYEKETDQYRKLYDEIILHYYQHQYHESLYSLCHKNEKYEHAKLYITKAQWSIRQSLESINKILKIYKNKINDDIYKKCKRFEIDFTLELNTTEVMSKQTEAKIEMKKGNYIGAFDIYNVLNEKASTNLDFIKKNDFEEKFKRIQTGNLLAMKLNALNMQIAFMNENVSYSDRDFFEKLIKIYESADELCNVNPEYNGYIDRKKDTTHNLKVYLSMNTHKWHDLLLENNNPILRRLMMEIDKKKFIELKVKEEISNKKTVMGLVSLLVVTGIVFLFVYYFTEKNIGTLTLSLLVLFILFLYTIALTFLLRFSDKLSEEKFIDVWKLLIISFPKNIANKDN